MVLSLLPVSSYAEEGPAAPVISSIERNGTAALTVRWEDDSEDVAVYEIRYSNDSSMTDPSVVRVRNTDLREKKIRGLSSYTRYYITVTAVDEEGLSASSKVRSRRTGIETPAVRKKAKGQTYITVTWSRGEKDTKGYEIQYSKGKRPVKNIRIKARKTTSKKIGKLYPYTSYRFRVRTVGDGMKSKWSEWKTVRTKKAGRKYLQNLIEDTSHKSKVKVFNSDYDINKTKKGRKLLRYLRKMKKKYRVSVVMIDLYSGAGFSSSSHTQMYSASCLKGPYVAAINRYRPGKANRYRSSQRQTIVQSNNVTYLMLRGAFGRNVIRKYCRRAGSTSYVGNHPYAYVLPKDLAKLWVENYWYFFRDTNRNSKKTRRLYTHGHLAFINHALKATVYTKPGWFPGAGKNTYNDAGIVMSKVNGEKRPYVVVVMSKGWGHKKELTGLVQLINSVHKEMVSE